MESIKTRGLIIKSTDYGEANRMIKLFTADLGIIWAGVYGARSKKKGLGASSRLFGWGEVHLKGTPDRYRAEEITICEDFYPLSEDIVSLAAAVYFAELAEVALGEHNPDFAVLRLLLNTLYAVSYNGVGVDTAKAVYELRLAKECGYMPALESCAVCGGGGEMWFDAPRGGIVCSGCRHRDSVEITPGVLAAMRYVLSADEKRIFAFKAESKILADLGRLSEAYISTQLERRLSSLEYLNKIK